MNRRRDRNAARGVTDVVLCLGIADGFGSKTVSIVVHGLFNGTEWEALPIDSNTIAGWGWFDYTTSLVEAPV